LDRTTSRYELPLPQSRPVAAEAAAGRRGERLPEAILIRNVLWFCHLRWIVIAILMVFGLAAMSDAVVKGLGLRPPGVWPLVAAGVLVLGNVVFLTHARFLGSSARPNSATTNLWGQIVQDLLVLTAVVHFCGSFHTYVPFTYLFHIVLACVFFSHRQSLVVTLLACVLFAACIAAEHAGLIRPAGLFAETSPDGASPSMLATTFLSAVAIWMVVWYLASGMSTIIRQRDRELAETNRRLVASQKERSRHMLTNTHQLKAPFAAIYANAQLLQDGHCGTLPSGAVEVIRRIAARCRRLATEIQDMLQLANLDSVGQKPPAWIELDLADVIRLCVQQVEPMAAERGVSFVQDLQPARTVGVDDHLQMLFMNLLANAVAYSRPGGRVRVRCEPGGQDGPRVTIADNGIGIPAAKVPRIFEEHYRTKEAVAHNKESSGLGLAIVRRVAELHRIHLQVESQPGKGTTFEMWFTPAHEASNAAGTEEKHDGLPTYC
jgi:signal transduction histidine kinase